MAHICFLENTLEHPICKFAIRTSFPTNSKEFKMTKELGESKYEWELRKQFSFFTHFSEDQMSLKKAIVYRRTLLFRGRQ